MIIIIFVSAYTQTSLGDHISVLSADQKLRQIPNSHYPCDNFGVIWNDSLLTRGSGIKGSSSSSALWPSSTISFFFFFFFLSPCSFFIHSTWDYFEKWGKFLAKPKKKKSWKILKEGIKMDRTEDLLCYKPLRKFPCRKVWVGFTLIQIKLKYLPTNK